MGRLAKLLPRLMLLEEQRAHVAQQATRQHALIEEKLSQLIQYRNEYSAAESGVPTLILDAQCFLQRLDDNITEIRAAAERQSKVVKLESGRWHSMHVRRLALQMLIEKENKNHRIANRRKEIGVAETLQVSHRLLNSKKD